MENRVSIIYIYVNHINKLKIIKLMEDLKKNTECKCIHIGSKMSTRDYKHIRNRVGKNLIVIHTVSKRYSIIAMYNDSKIEDIKLSLIEVLNIIENSKIQTEFIGYVNNDVSIDTNIKQVYLGYEGDKRE